LLNVVWACSSARTALETRWMLDAVSLISDFPRTVCQVVNLLHRTYHKIRCRGRWRIVTGRVTVAKPTRVEVTLLHLRKNHSQRCVISLWRGKTATVHIYACFRRAILDNTRYFHSPTNIQRSIKTKSATAPLQNFPTSAFLLAG
jgi:hypothetical protein